MFLRFIEILLVIGGAVVIVTQIIFPLFDGRVLFPFFRERKLVTEYRHVKQDAEEAEMKKGIEEVRKSINEKGESTDESAK